MSRSILLLLLLLLGACTTAPKRVEPGPVPKPAASSQPSCLDCGVVQDIRTVGAASEAAAAKKPVLGGIVGGVVSKPSASKPAARYEILIRMLNGKKILVTQSILSSGLRVGSKVRVSQGRILAVGP